MRRTTEVVALALAVVLALVGCTPVTPGSPGDTWLFTLQADWDGISAVNISWSATDDPRHADDETERFLTSFYKTIEVTPGVPLTVQMTAVKTVGATVTAHPNIHCHLSARRKSGGRLGKAVVNSGTTRVACGMTFIRFPPL